MLLLPDLLSLRPAQTPLAEVIGYRAGPIQTVSTQGNSQLAEGRASESYQGRIRNPQDLRARSGSDAAASSGRSDFALPSGRPLIAARRRATPMP
jgi:hypothetical protein